MSKDFEKDIQACLRVLNNKGAILYPTDTVWGLGCDATDEPAVQKIMQIKNRPANKSFVVLIESIEKLKNFVPEIDHNLIRFASTVRKPTTIIYPNTTGFAKSVAAVDGSVAIRICTEPFCTELLRQLDKPLLSTSANKSGEPTPRIFKEIDPSIILAVDYTVQYRQDDNVIAKPSTIVKWENNKIIIIRE